MIRKAAIMSCVRQQRAASSCSPSPPRPSDSRLCLLRLGDAGDFQIHPRKILYVQSELTAWLIRRADTKSYYADVHNILHSNYKIESLYVLSLLLKKFKKRIDKYFFRNSYLLLVLLLQHHCLRILPSLSTLKQHRRSKKRPHWVPSIFVKLIKKNGAVRFYIHWIYMLSNSSRPVLEVGQSASFIT